MQPRCLNCNVIICSLQFYEVKVLSPSIKNKLTKWLGTKVQNQRCICRPCYLLLHVKSDEKRALGYTDVCSMCAFPINDGDAKIIEDDDPILQECMPWNKPQESDYKNLVCKECWHNYNNQNYSESRESDECKVKEEVEIDYHDDSDANDTEYLYNTPVVNQDSDNKHLTLELEEMQSLKHKIDTEIYHPHSNETNDNDTHEVVILPNYKRIVPTSKCVFSKCQNETLVKIPNRVKRIMLHDYNYYIPLASKICETHLNSNDWELLITEDTMSIFSGEDVEDIFTVLNVPGDYDQDSDDGFNWD